jgi:hypothetical protein
VVAFEGNQAGDPALRAATKEAAKARTSDEAGPGYAERWKVERTFAWLGNFRRLLVRHEHCLSTFRAFVLIAFILVSLKRLP